MLIAAELYLSTTDPSPHLHVRLYDMMGWDGEGERGMVYGMDERYCIDNGAMTAQAGRLGDGHEWTDHSI